MDRSISLVILLTRNGVKMQRSILSMFNKPFDLSSGLPSLESQSGLFDRSSFSTQPLNLSSFRDDIIDTLDRRKKDWCCCVATCWYEGPRVQYGTYKSRRGIIWAARRGAARGCGRCGGSRVHAGSDLTLDSRAHVYAYTTPAAARRHRHRCLPALNTLNILHAHQLTERRRYPPTALPKNSQSRRVHIRRT